MNDTARLVLGLMVKQFHSKHQRHPGKIVLTPLALLALALKNSAPTSWQGIPVVCREVGEAEATDREAEASSLAVFVLPEDRTGRLVACDLKT